MDGRADGDFDIARDSSSSRDAGTSERPIGGNPFAGLRLVLSSPYLGGIAVFVFLMSAVTTVLYLQQAGLLQIYYPDGDARSSFLGSIELAMNLVTIALQFFAVGRLTKQVGVASMIVVVPLFVVAGFLLIAAHPTFLTLVCVLVASVACARRPLAGDEAGVTESSHDSTADQPATNHDTGGESPVPDATAAVTTGGMDRRHE